MDLRIIIIILFDLTFIFHFLGHVKESVVDVHAPGLGHQDHGLGDQGPVPLHPGMTAKIFNS